MWAAAKKEMAAKTQRQLCPHAMRAQHSFVKGLRRVPGHSELP